MVGTARHESDGRLPSRTRHTRNRAAPAGRAAGVATGNHTFTDTRVAVVVVARVVLKLAWEPAVVAVAVLAALWLLGAAPL